MQHLWSQVLNFFVFHFIQHKFHTHFPVLTSAAFSCSCSNEMAAFTLLWCQFTCLAQPHKSLRSTSHLYFVGILSTGCLSIMWRQILHKLLALCSTHLTRYIHISSWSCRTHYQTISVQFFLVALHLPSHLPARGIYVCKTQQELTN